MTLKSEDFLLQRAWFGRPYRNLELEMKRQSAICWLRERSRRGWVMDEIHQTSQKMKRLMYEEKQG
jgi:hypothetical protein